MNYYCRSDVEELVENTQSGFCRKSWIVEEEKRSKASKAMEPSTF